MSSLQRNGLIKLIYKKGDKLLPNNWRPISLLNTDLKKATSALAHKLQKILPNIINTDQAGYINGGFIGHNIRLITDIINFFKIKNFTGAILFLDFKKAFDTVEWPFM